MGPAERRFSPTLRYCTPSTASANFTAVAKKP